MLCTACRNEAQNGQERTKVDFDWNVGEECRSGLHVV